MDRQQFKRGDVCKRIDPPVQKRVPIYYLVMRVVDSENLLVVPIYDVCDYCAINCRLNTGIFKIKYSAFQNVKSQYFKKEKNVWLYSAKECISEVYEKCKDYHRQQYCKSMEKKAEARQLAKELKELHRLRMFDLQTHEHEPVPKSVSWYARHPLQGGLVNPR